MTEDNNKPAKRGRPKKQKASEEAQQLFPDYTPAEERANKLDHDVDDIFADLPDFQDEDNSNDTSENDPSNIPSESYYAKKEQPEPARTPDIYDNLVEQHKTITSPGLDKEALNDMVRAEEIAAEIVRTKGRFIEGVDNAKPGVTFRGPDEQVNPALLEGIEYNTSENPHMFVEKPKHVMRADGVTLSGVLDTGAGAQVSEKGRQISDRDNPASEGFMVCVNRDCRYREHCMRYRMNNQRDMKTVFYPEDCRRDGIYMNIEEHDFTAYSPFEVLESKSTPSF